MRLSILYLTTCVGLQYGSLLLMLRSFSWKHGIDYFSVRSPFRIVITSQINEEPDLPNSPTYSLKHGQPSPC